MVDLRSRRGRSGRHHIGRPIAGTSAYVLDEHGEARADRRARRAVHRRRRRGSRLPRAPGADRRALRPRSFLVATPTRGSIAPAISRAGAATASCSTSDAPTSRSRCAAIASSSARSRSRWPAIRRSPRPPSSRARAPAASSGSSPTSSPAAGRTSRPPRRSASTCASTARLHDPDGVQSPRAPAAHAERQGRSPRAARSELRGSTATRRPVTTRRAPPSEQLIAEVWRELLGVERIDVLDNFLDLGGHSLLIMRAVAMLEARTGKRLSPRAFVFQTLEQLARDYEQVSSESPASGENGVAPGSSPPTRNGGLLRQLLSIAAAAAPSRDSRRPMGDRRAATILRGAVSSSRCGGRCHHRRLAGLAPGRHPGDRAQPRLRGVRPAAARASTGAATVPATSRPKLQLYPTLIAVAMRPHGESVWPGQLISLACVALAAALSSRHSRAGSAARRIRRAARHAEHAGRGRGSAPRSSPIRSRSSPLRSASSPSSPSSRRPRAAGSSRGSPPPRSPGWSSRRRSSSASRRASAGARARGALRRPALWLGWAVVVIGVAAFLAPRAQPLSSTTATPSASSAAVTASCRRWPHWSTGNLDQSRALHGDLGCGCSRGPRRALPRGPPPHRRRGGGARRRRARPVGARASLHLRSARHALPPAAYRARCVARRPRGL